MITQERLREVLSYDDRACTFVWRLKISKKVIVGSAAGGMNASGYIVIGMGGKIYYAHRLAFIYMTGRAPEMIDHKDGDRANNSWANLREATSQQNILNAKLAANNTSGFKGVSWHRGAGKWSAYIILNERKRHLGLFDNPERAHAAYLATARQAQPEFARAS